MILWAHWTAWGQGFNGHKPQWPFHVTNPWMIGPVLAPLYGQMWMKLKRTVVFWNTDYRTFALKAFPPSWENIGIKLQYRVSILKITIKSIEKACHNNVLLTSWRKTCPHSCVCYLKLTLKASSKGVLDWRKD